MSNGLLFHILEKSPKTIQEMKNCSKSKLVLLEKHFESIIKLINDNEEFFAAKEKK